MIVKLVNLNETAKEVKVVLNGVAEVDSTVKVTTLSANGLDEINSFETPMNICDVQSSIEVEGPNFSYAIAPYSFVVLRVAIK